MALGPEEDVRVALGIIVSIGQRVTVLYVSPLNPCQ